MSATKERKWLTAPAAPWRISQSKTYIEAGAFRIFLSASMGAFPEQWHAIAQLLAAAPDMYEALELAAEGPLSSMRAMNSPAAIATRKALAKARGEA